MLSYQLGLLFSHIPYSGLFMQVATFTDVFNVPRAVYFHCCIIHDIKLREWHQTIFAMFTRGRLIKVPVRKGS